MKNPTPNLSRIIILLLLGSLCQGCYKYHISTTNFDPSTSYNKGKTKHTLWWGLFPKRTNGVDFVATDCDALNLNSLDQVQVVDNLGYCAITVVTLGFWHPVKVKWKCPPPCPVEGKQPQKDKSKL